MSTMWGDDIFSLKTLYHKIHRIIFKNTNFGKIMFFCTYFGIFLQTLNTYLRDFTMLLKPD